MSIVPIRRAIISVSQKKGIEAFARKLSQNGVHILSTGGTAKILREAGIKVQEVSDYTGFPELMEGRIKTLHPLIHGGILAKREPQNLDEARKNGIEMIDLVVVNLYPFEETVKQGCSEETAIEHIDIGGPSMLRSAAKNFPYVTVVTDSEDYDLVLSEIEQHGGTTLETRKHLAAKIFRKTALYDEAISEYFQMNGGKSELLDLHYEKVLSLRYGENPHQKAAFFRDPHNHYPNVTNAKVLQGKQLSYNNILDTDAGIKVVQDFERPTAALIKHTNPCGVASAERIEEAFEKAYLSDTISAYGCVIVLNRPCSAEIVRFIQKHEIFVEIISATDFDEKALNLLAKRKNLRVLSTGELKANPSDRDIKSVGGGILVQNIDLSSITIADVVVVTQRKPTEAEMRDMLFARTVVKHVKSNAVVFAKNEITTGIGAGQMSRVDSVFIAAHKGGNRVDGSVMASDAFFPFSDAVEEAHKVGITAVIQPGGSIRDREIIAKADELGMTMVFTGVRSFKH